MKCVRNNRSLVGVHNLLSCLFELSINLACEQALLRVGGGRGKEERACNDVSGIFISALNFATQNADWWILNLVLMSLLFACVVLTTNGGGVSICKGCENFPK